MPEAQTFSHPLLEIQPSQLFINAAKLSVVLCEYPRARLEQEHFPVLRINGAWTFSDQHTRALAAYLHGIRQVQIYPDPDDLSMDMYRVCVDWCTAENIHSIRDLSQRVIDDTDYQVRWIERCRCMHARFEVQSNGTGSK